MIELVRDPKAWQRRCAAERAAGRRLALVPTMGFLHDGHLSLMCEARRLADVEGASAPVARQSRTSRHPSLPGAGRGVSLATIFVNPTQFGPAEDLARYPRDLSGDLAKCEAAGVDLVLAPERPELVFAPGHETWITVERSARGLCGERRPGHFRGVATVVAKLFHLSVPHVALFGEKDWQQVQVLRAMVRDLDFDVELVAMPILREADGLALSSRNAYLSPDERRRALTLSRELFAARERALAGERDVAALTARIRAALGEAGARVDYVEVADASAAAGDTAPAVAAPGSRLLAAAYFGATRLIDNVELLPLEGG